VANYLKEEIQQEGASVAVKRAYERHFSEQNIDNMISEPLPAEAGTGGDILGSFGRRLVGDVLIKDRI